MPPSVPPAAPSRKRRAPLLIVLAAAVAALIWWAASTPPGDDANPTDGTAAEADAARPPDPWAPLLAASPYRNVHPDVKYVSDDSCAECHAEIAASFAQHPMGRSLSPVQAAEAIETFPADDASGLDIDGFAYQVRRDGKRQFHRETRLSPAGEEALTTEFEAVYAIGSGQTGRSYVIERDGHLFMSPVTWYADHGWDLSPGFEVNNSHFNRPIVSECLFCHANRTHHVEGTLNKYEPPIFAGHAIGCQRCHGPGELHVAAQESGDAADPDNTIVNPARLEPHLRESVCQQCHLGGLVRVETRGRRREEFRPGLPWSAVEAVFMSATPTDAASPYDQGPPTGPTRNVSQSEPVDRFVGHVEQMHSSGCYVGSGGKLGCISCHDPHRLPAEADKVAYYRGRCLECHGEPDCTLPVDERRAREPDDSCMACHMPRAGTQIRHAAATDHRILRAPGARPKRYPSAPGLDWSPLVAFDASKFSENAEGAGFLGGANPPAPTSDELDQRRNLAVALTMAMDRHPDLVDRGLLPQTIDLLGEAVRRDGADVRAREALAFSLGRGRDLSPALELIEDVLRQSPRRESSLAAAAAMLASAGQWPNAADLWGRARDVNPWIVRYWFELALCYSRMGRWDDCAAACEQALERFPDSFGARQLLVECRLVAGRLADAEKEYNRMIELNPPQIDALRRWWNNHPLRKPGARRAAGPAA
jgi:tetratricopeptide (TPR) repeat protein